jgi:beta-fructofuranosidase
MIKCINPTDRDWYPSYHLAPEKGWLSDPNGLIFHDGYYHAFYQHYPHKPYAFFGPMHWGHAISKNMLDWEHLPPALTPSIDHDFHGCFSGSSVNDNGKLSFLYTGNSIDQVQAQCLAVMADEIRFEKAGLVIPAPEGIRDIRDPKVWRQDDKWYMVLAVKTDAAQVDVYTSDDLREWEFDSTLLKESKLLFCFYLI